MSASLRSRLVARLRARSTQLTLAGLAVVSLAALCLIATAAPATNSGYIAKVTNSLDTVTTAPYFTCSGAAAADKTNSSAYLQWYLNEATNSTVATDSASGLIPGAYQGSMTTTTTTPLACSRDTGGAYTLNGTTSYVAENALALPIVNPTTFSIEIWFKTTVAGGKLIGFGNARTGSSGQYDRHLYIDSTGKLQFGTYNGGVQTIASPAAVTDGKWHLAVGTMSAGTGMKLFLDGVQVAANATYTTPEVNNAGYWRVGYDNIGGWTNTPTNYFFTGQLRFAAVYTSVLSATQVQADYWAGQ